MTLLRDFAVGYAVKNHYEKKYQQQQQQQQPQQSPYQPPYQPFYQQGPYQQGPFQHGPYQQGPYQQGPYQQGPHQPPYQPFYPQGSYQQQYDSRQSQPHQQPMMARRDVNEPQDRGYSRDMPQDANFSETRRSPDDNTRVPPPYQEKDRR